MRFILEKIDNNQISLNEEIKEPQGQSAEGEVKISKNQMKREKKAEKWLEIKQKIKEKK